MMKGYQPNFSPSRLDCSRKGHWGWFGLLGLCQLCLLDGLAITLFTHVYTVYLHLADFSGPIYVVPLLMRCTSCLKA